MCVCVCVYECMCVCMSVWVCEYDLCIHKQVYNLKYPAVHYIINTE